MTQSTYNINPWQNNILMNLPLLSNLLFVPSADFQPLSVEAMFLLALQSCSLSKLRAKAAAT